MIEFLYYVGYFTLILFTIQTVLILTGGDIDSSDGEIDTDIDADEISMFGYLSWKNLVNFFAIFSWTTIGFLEAEFAFWAAASLGVVGGIIFVIIMILLFKLVASLAEDGTFDIKENAVGKFGVLTISIDDKPGKISLSVKGKNITGKAISTGGEHIKTGYGVVVDSYENSTFFVSPRVTHTAQ